MGQYIKQTDLRPTELLISVFFSFLSPGFGLSRRNWCQLLRGGPATAWSELLKRATPSSCLHQIRLYIILSLNNTCCGAYCWWMEKKRRVWPSILLSSTVVAAPKRGTVSLPVYPNWCASVNTTSRPPSSLGLQRPLLPAQMKLFSWPTCSSYKTRSPRWNLAVGSLSLSFASLDTEISKPHSQVEPGKKEIVDVSHNLLLFHTRYSLSKSRVPVG